MENEQIKWTRKEFRLQIAIVHKVIEWRSGTVQHHSWKLYARLSWNEWESNRHYAIGQKFVCAAIVSVSFASDVFHNKAQQHLWELRCADMNLNRFSYEMINARTMCQNKEFHLKRLIKCLYVPIQRNMYLPVYHPMNMIHSIYLPSMGTGSMLCLSHATYVSVWRMRLIADSSHIETHKNVLSTTIKDQKWFVCFLRFFFGFIFNCIQSLLRAMSIPSMRYGSSG